MPGIHWFTHNLCTIDNFLSEAECAALIARGEGAGFESAMVSTADGPQLLDEVRNNDRVIFDDPALAEDLWTRVDASVTERLTGAIWRAAGLNERLRFYRYGPGQRFDWHCDGNFVRSEIERSEYTFMIYLNETFEGGETLFRSLPGYGLEDLVVQPKTGMAILFEHPICHRGDVVRRGSKYVLRSDVMFRAD